MGNKKRVGVITLLLAAGLSQLACAANVEKTVQPEELLGNWQVETVQDRPVVDRSPASIAFAKDGSFSGNASCNRMAGEYVWKEGKLELGQAAVTRMACPPALMEQEQRLLAALALVAQARLENGLLLLEDIAGNLMIRAAPHNLQE